MINFSVSINYIYFQYRCLILHISGEFFLMRDNNLV